VGACALSLADWKAGVDACSAWAAASGQITSRFLFLFEGRRQLSGSVSASGGLQGPFGLIFLVVICVDVVMRTTCLADVQLRKEYMCIGYLILFDSMFGTISNYKILPIAQLVMVVVTTS
jgi:hypothetical protein